MTQLDRLLRRMAQAWQRFLELEMLWAGLFVLVGLWVLLPSQTFFSTRVEVGEIATREFVASRDLLEEDQETTLEKQENARAAALPVYDYEPAIARDLENQIIQLFEVGRSSLFDDLGLVEIGDSASTDEVELEEPPLSPLVEFLAASQLKVETNELELMARAEFSPSLEDRLRNTVTQLLRSGLVRDTRRLLENRERGVIVRDLESGEETLDVDLYRRVEFPDEAEELIDSESRLWTDLSRSDRAALSTFLMANLVPNLELNRSETRSRREAAAAATAPVFRQRSAGQVIVRKGDEITPTAALLINGNQGQRRFTDLAVPTLGKLLLLSLASLLLWSVSSRERHLVDSRQRVVGGLSLILIVSLLLTRFGFLAAAALGGFFETTPFKVPESYFFAIPYASVGLVTFLLYGRRLAVVMSLVFSLIAGQFVVGGSLAVVVVALSGSLAAIYFQDQLKRRSGVTRTGLVVGGANMIATLMVLALEGDRLLDLQATVLCLAAAFVGGLLVAAVASVLLPVLEWALGLTTDMTLIMLSNTNLPLLRRLAFEAPGTFQHSLMVANLAKCGCAEIGANAVLAYTGALYHDIGKVLSPDYFIENQQGRNPHDDLEPSRSAQIVINHVKEGLELGKEQRLPRVVLDAIVQHHGTHLLTFFHNRALEAEGTAAVDEEAYRYPGPRPQNKVMGVLMLADAVEAASRTLSEPSAQTIHNLVAKITDSHVRDGQLDETDLTLGDLNTVSEEFELVLSSLHHRRVDYPGFDFDALPAESRLQVVGR